MNITPRQMAEIFASSSADEQAAFFCEAYHALVRDCETKERYSRQLEAIVRRFTDYGSVIIDDIFCAKSEHDRSEFSAIKRKIAVETREPHTD